MVESVKGASDIYAPISGKVVAVNEAVAKTPSLVNKFPMSEGWICKIQLADSGELNGLMDSASYIKHCEESEC